MGRNGNYSLLDIGLVLKKPYLLVFCELIFGWILHRICRTIG